MVVPTSPSLKEMFNVSVSVNLTDGTDDNDKDNVDDEIRDEVKNTIIHEADNKIYGDVDDNEIDNDIGDEVNHKDNNEVDVQVDDDLVYQYLPRPSYDELVLDQSAEVLDTLEEASTKVLRVDDPATGLPVFQPYS